MKKHLSLLVALMVTLFSFSSFAFTVPEKPANGWYVLDQAGKLSEDEKDKLNHKIEDLNKTTKNEYAVVILSTLDGGNIEDAAQDTFRAWGVGKKDLNNGVLLMISTGERKTRIQTGKGAEGDLPDLRCKDILDNSLKPHLKRGHFYAGIDAALDAMSSHMENRNTETPSTNTPAVTPTSSPSGGCSMVAAGDATGGSLLLLLLAGGAGVFIYSRVRAAKRRQAEALAEMEALQETARLNNERATRDRQARERLARSAEVTKPVPLRLVPPPVPVTIPKQVSVPRPHVAPAPVLVAPRPVSSNLGLASVAAASASALALAEETRRAEASARRRREDEEREAERKRRKRQQEDDDRRRRDDDDRRSSSSSWDSGSSFGGGFGGGDSGGGGSSSDY